MRYCISVYDIERIREELLHIFPDAIRGSVAKSKWGNGRKQLHLNYWISSDTVGGYRIDGRGPLLYFVDWDTNDGSTVLFAESEADDMIARVKNRFAGRVMTIARIVGET